MRICLVGCLLLWIGSALAMNTWKDDAEARRLFQEFRNKHNKNYNGYDVEKRFGIFKDNLKRAEEYQRNEQGTAKYGVTQFSDLTAEEFRAHFANAKLDHIPNLKRVRANGVNDIPKSVDWRKHGAVGPVEEQGYCGSCWAFSVTGNIEGQWFMKTKQLITLSKQELLDCDPLDSACDGGYPPQTYEAIKMMGGLEKQTDYPYHAHRGMCLLEASKVAVYINSSVTIDQSEVEQAKWLAQHGPMATVLNGDPLQFYHGGVLKPYSCPPDGINHAVLTVGYGEENGSPYWLVKNSWGRSFGEDGYFRLYRGEGTCGINLLATSAVIN